MYDDFYNEGPSDFDIAIEEFKESLRQTVKKEILHEIDHLKKENEKLQDIKQNFEKIKQDYEDKKRQFEIKESNMMYDLTHKKIKELTTIVDFDHLYCLDDTIGYLPKCDNCDDQRLIHFKSPSGRDCTEDCPICGKRYSVYYVKPLDTIKIRFTNNPLIEREVYAVRCTSYGDSIVYETKDVYKESADQFDIEDNYKVRHTAFDSKELAQQVCDRVNKKKNIPDNVIFKSHEE